MVKYITYLKEIFYMKPKTMYNDYMSIKTKDHSWPLDISISASTTFITAHFYFKTCS